MMSNAKRKRARTAPVKAKAAFQNARRRLCTVHGYVRHGKEAEELRDGVEEILGNLPGNPDDLSGFVAREALDDVRTLLIGLLDRVDARDSLAYVERHPRRRAS